MMNCSCCTTALRIFVRSIAHIQVPASVAASRLPVCPSLPGSARGFRSLERAASTLPSSTARSIHTTGYRADNVAAAITAGRHTGRAGKTSNRNEGEREFTLSSEAPAAPAAPLPAKSAAKSAGRDKTSKGRKPRGRPDDGGSKPTIRKVVQDDTGKLARRLKTIKGPNPEREPPRMSIQAKMQEDSLEEEVGSREYWKAQKAALKEKFPEGWQPRKKLSPDALAGIRALHAEFPNVYTTKVLADKFEMSAEAIRRILKSKWAPSAEEELERQERWFNRGKKVWSRWAELGKKPPQKWRKEGIVRDPIWHEKRGPRPMLEEEDDEGNDESPADKARAKAQRMLSKNLM
ncbi:hypothetical protein B0H67DRAFT_557992 [Lasiosphaeris hirsuta]|uniref:Required for respiratory growth protein 9, mitochondrial n=1 Tax=Lasiosphaeris hirsuta TaxID=260670 RepID=A0AA39ZXD5_9PEZI|nr:hypothetical protein B0H67DRAFT_557992 [Lasiosphaeris hirsuta]